MAALKLTIVLLAFMLGLVASAPAPGFFGHKHEHVLIHVPYKVHTVHHHHFEKVPIYKHIPIIKHVPIVKEVHVPYVKEVHVPYHHHDVHEYKGWNSGWW